jgi:hypothetical protein
VTPILEEVFGALREILSEHAPRLVVAADASGAYSLNTDVTAPNGKPMFFGGASIRKNFVSYYLMPVYTSPDLLDDISQDLRRRMQGKSCFNFKRVDEALFAELAELTDRGFMRFEQDGWITS